MAPAAAEAARERAVRTGTPLREALLLEGVPAEALAALEAAARSAAESAARTPAAPGRPTGAEGSPTMLSPGIARPPSSAPTQLTPAGRRPSTSDATLVPGGTPPTQPAASAPRRSGRLTHIGKYEIVEELGRGGMGVVYKARHPGLDRTVALKTLIAVGSPEHVERFLREARSAARMGKHPNLVQVHDVGEDAGVYYFTMEFIEGRGFDREVHNDAPPPRRVAEVVEQVARGLAHAHAEGVVHRDLKPANILIDMVGRPLISDFGLAKEVGAGSSVSVAGQILGTPAYMSPEQAEGHLELVNERSDVYGLGAILYEGLTRRPPFEAAGNIELLRKVTGEEPVLPSRLAAGIPRDLEVICLKCLSKRPEDRYESAAALADDLRRFLDGDPILARPVPFSVRLLRRARRNPLVAALSAAAVLLLVVGSIVTVRLLRERADRLEQSERDRIAEADRAAVRKQVEEHLRSGREWLQKAERAMRLDVAVLAGTAIGREPLDAALREFDAAIALAPETYDARHLRLRTLRILGRLEEAVAEADWILVRRPDDHATALERTHARIAQLQLLSGVTIAVDYSFFASLGNQAKRLHVLGRDPRQPEVLAEVIRELKRLSGSGIPAGDAHYCRAMVLHFEGKQAEALTECDAAIAADPFLSEAVSLRAELLVVLFRFDEARAEYQRLVLARPFDALTHLLYANFETDVPKALAACDRAVELAPVSSVSWRERGRRKAAAGMQMEAVADLKRALELDPEDVGALEFLFGQLTNLGDFEAAEPLGRRAVELAPDSFDLWHDLGRAYRDIGRDTEAIACFDQALRLDPGFGLYLWARGRARLNAGLFADGVRDMLDAVESGDMSDGARTVFANFRKTTEKTIAAADTHAKMAKHARNLTGMLRMVAGTASPDRKAQYDASILTMQWVEVDMWEKAENWSRAAAVIEELAALNTETQYLAYRRARIAAARYDLEGARTHLGIARDRGMIHLGTVRVDPGFQRFRDWDGYAAWASEFGGRP